MSGTPKIAIHGLEKAFGPKRVLRGVDLEVQPGESVVIVGGSGTGKSVTLKCVLGLLRPDAGRIEIDGEDVTHPSRRERRRLARRIGMLFQNAALFDSLSVVDNVAFGLVEGGGTPRDEARRTAIEMLEHVGLGEDVAALMPGELSGGMQKRVGLARAIATRPEILFFDEPTTGLDPIMSDVIDDLIVRCTREMGAAALTITHDMRSARRIGDRIAMLYDGRIIWDGPADRVLDSGNPYLDQFVNGRLEGPIPVTVG